MSAPAWLTGLLDDTSLFPPHNADLGRAVAEHRAARSGEFADLVNRLVISDHRIPDLIDVLDESDQHDHEEALALSVLVTGGAGAVAPAVRWASRAPSLHLGAIEVTLRDEDDLAHNVRRFLTALDTVEEDLSEVEVYVELPRLDGAPTHGWLSALDEIAAADLRAKFRTGAAAPDLCPTPEEVLSGIDAALDRELRFTFSSGHPHAITTPGAPRIAHGFLNLLVATAAALEGGEPMAALVHDPGATLLDGVPPEDLVRARRWLVSFGSGSLLDSHDDLVELGILGGQHSAGGGAG